MPVATAPSLPDTTAPYITKLEINTPAVGANDDNTTAAAGGGAGNQGASDAGSNQNGGADMAREERERQIKLGALLVRLGAAKEKSVFGARGLTVPPLDLLVINRPEDAAEARRPFKWYDPISWFLSGPRSSPMLWSRNTSTRTSSHPSASPSFSSHRATTTAPTVDTSVERSLKKKKKAHRLPVVDMQPLEDDANLELAVREERAKLLKDEEAVHRALDGIEYTRYAYLVPSQEIRCEAEVNSVVQCYKSHNAAARIVKSEAPSTSPTVLPAAASVLDCGPVVALLRRCAEDVAATYGAADGSH